MQVMAREADRRDESVAGLVPSLAWFDWRASVVNAATAGGGTVGGWWWALMHLGLIHDPYAVEFLQGCGPPARPYSRPPGELGAEEGVLTVEDA